jgi:hypothetical protein
VVVEVVVRVEAEVVVGVEGEVVVGGGESGRSCDLFFGFSPFLYFSILLYFFVFLCK